MAVSLRAFAESLSKGKVTVCEQELEFRLLSDGEVGRLISLYPEPLPPPGRNPNAGSVAPPIPNLMDDAYRRADADWNERLIRLQVICAFGFGEEGLVYDPKLSDAELRTRLDELITLFAATFNRNEVGQMWAAYYRKLNGGADRQRKLREALIVDLEGVVADQKPEAGMRLPKEYANTAAYAKLEVCHYFRISPFEIDEVDRGMLWILFAHVQLKREEQAS